MVIICSGVFQKHCSSTRKAVDAVATVPFSLTSIVALMK